MNVTEPIREHARRQPAAPAYAGVPRRVQLDYRAFDRAIDAFAARALASGLRAGQTAIVDLQDTLAHIVATLALMRIGVAAAVPTLADRFADVRLAPRATEGSPLREVVVDWDWLAPDAADPAPAAIAPGGDAVCAIFGTSGTTGEPKHFAITHAMLARRLQTAATTMPLPPEPRALVQIGLRASITLLCLLHVHRAGGLVAFPELNELLPSIRARGVNTLFAAPSSVARMLRDLPADARVPPSIVRVFLTGGAVPARLLAEVRRRVCADVRVAYGATEVGPIAGAALADIGDLPGAAGVVAPGADVQCVGDDGRPLPAGSEGVVRIRRNPGSGVYVDAPEASAAAFRGDWFHPGDIGTLSAQRVLVITGRETDVVNVGGDKRSLAVIERQVREHEGIVDAGAFVVEGALGVPEVRVAVVAAPGVDVAGLAARLASHGELPRGTRFVAAADIPRNALGKVDRAALLAQAGGRAPAAATRP